MIKGAIFDLDGLLIDTEKFQRESWIEILKPFGAHVTKEEYFEYSGKTGKFIEAGIIKNHNLQTKKGALLEKKEKLLLEWLKTKKIEILPFGKEAIKFFSEREMKVAVCSSSPRDELKLKLRRTGLSPFFKVVVSRDDVERGKPHPDMYLLAAKEIGLKPEECIAFEDTQYGMESAKSAGMVCLAVPNELSRKQDFSRADGVFKNLKEAIDWIKEKHTL